MERGCSIGNYPCGGASRLINRCYGPYLHATVYARANAMIEKAAINAISLIEALQNEPWALRPHLGLARDHLP
jgi:hypothetical protein